MPLPDQNSSMTFAEWFAWIKDIYETNPHAHDWRMKSNGPDGGVAPVFEPSKRRVII